MKQQSDRARDIDRATYIIEQIVSMLHRDEAESPDSPQTEYVRGGLWGAKWVLSGLLGDRFKDDVAAALR